MDSSFINESKEVVVLKESNLTIPLRDVKKEERQFFDKEEMIALLNQVPPDKNGMLFQVLWRTGLRVSEVISVTKGDIDFQNNTMRAKWLKNRKYYSRTIPLHSTLKNPLYLFIAQLKESDKIFNISRQRVFQLSKKYGFMHPHKIRHSFAVNFLRQRKDPFAIIELRDLLGHSSINTTMEYLKIVPSAQIEVLNKISFD